MGLVHHDHGKALPVESLHQGARVRGEQAVAQHCHLAAANAPGKKTRWLTRWLTPSRPQLPCLQFFKPLNSGFNNNSTVKSGLNGFKLNSYTENSRSFSNSWFFSLMSEVKVTVSQTQHTHTLTHKHCIHLNSSNLEIHIKRVYIICHPNHPHTHVSAKTNLRCHSRSTKEQANWKTPKMCCIIFSPLFVQSLTHLIQGHVPSPEGFHNLFTPRLWREVEIIPPHKSQMQKVASIQNFQVELNQEEVEMRIKVSVFHEGATTT